MNKEEKEISEAMLNRYGLENRIQHFHEEVGEVMTAISHHRRGRAGNFEVLGELADLQVLLNQMIVLYDNDTHFGQIYEGKLQHVRGLLTALNHPVYTSLKTQEIPEWEADIDPPVWHLRVHTSGKIEIVEGKAGSEYLSDYNIVVQRIGNNSTLWDPYDGTEYESWCTDAKNERQAFENVMRDRPGGTNINVRYYLELIDDE